MYTTSLPVTQLPEKRETTWKTRSTKARINKQNVNNCCARAQQKFKIDVYPLQHHFKHAATEKQEIPFERQTTIKNGHGLLCKQNTHVP